MTKTLTTAQRVAQLPPLLPGVLVTIPLELLPAYLNLYHIEAMDRTAVSKLEERTGTRKEPGAVWVQPQLQDGKERQA
jgi:hypothetical protein